MNTSLRFTEFLTDEEFSYHFSSFFPVTFMLIIEEPALGSLR